jgi:hypothetical protein
MVKPFIWAGIVALAIALVVGGIFVIPHIGETPTTGLNGATVNPLSPLAVLVTGLGLAAGSTLIGIGIGRWQHPRPTAPTPAQHGAEV